MNPVGKLYPVKDPLGKVVATIEVKAAFHFENCAAMALSFYPEKEDHGGLFFMSYSDVDKLINDGLNQDELKKLPKRN